MARRKRLTPARTDAPDTPAPQVTPVRAPIAQVAGEASASAALGEVTGVLAAARAEGRMIEALPLTAIDDSHLVRDRLVQDDEDMAALMSSLEARGQQTPIEVVALPEPREGRTHGLISGARRLTALRRLCDLTQDDRFATVQARVIAPADAQAAYVAMVEENEIRAGLSLYEKGRITLRAVHEGVYPTPRAALRGLFGSVSRSRRSKIGSFAELVEPLDAWLRFPAAIPEKLGLGLARALADHAFATAVRLALQKAEAESPEAELAVLTRCLRDWTRAQPKDSGGPAPVPVAGPGPRITGPDPESVARRLAERRVEARLDAAQGRIVLSGGGVDAALLADLKAWLKTRRS
jgi:hypothetical protein